jgi:acyl carrier protein
MVDHMAEMERARQLIADAMNVTADLVPDDARIGRFERWDSLAHMRLVLAIERRIGRELDPDEALRIESLADIAGMLGK